VEVDAVTWPDTSLGCPKPGMMYPQVLVEGVLVQLRAATNGDACASTRSII